MSKNTHIIFSIMSSYFYFHIMFILESNLQILNFRENLRKIYKILSLEERLRYFGTRNAFTYRNVKEEINNSKSLHWSKLFCVCSYVLYRRYINVTKT